MELAKITSKGQVTLPREVRAALAVGEGDKIVFMRQVGGFLIVNADNVAVDKAKLAEKSMQAFRKCQEAFQGAAEEAGLKTIDDVVALVKEVRKERKNANSN